GTFGDADDGRLTDARQVVEHALDIFRKDVQSFRRHDHFLLATLDEDASVGVALADIAGVQPALSVDGALGFGPWALGVGSWKSGAVFLVVPARDILAAHEDLAVVGNPDFDAANRRA